MGKIENKGHTDRVGLNEETMKKEEIMIPRFKMMVGPMSAVLVLFVLFCAMIAAPVQAKDYTRTCHARYSVCPSSFRGVCWNFDFDGKGTIGYYNPNKARERARHNLDECIDTHWQRYTATGRPAECTAANQIYNYPVNSLIVDLSRNVCRLNPGHQTIQVGIGVIYSGQDGCTLSNNSWNRSITRNHTVFCTAEGPLH